jgi:hypothetical protein
MSPNHGRKMSLFDAILMVGSAAIGLGLFELAHRALFKGWIWIADRKHPDVQSWSTMEALVTCSDIMMFLLQVVIPWTFLLMLLRIRSPRPSWRRIWRQPGIAACLVAHLHDFVVVLVAIWERSSVRARKAARRHLCQRKDAGATRLAIECKGR